MTSLFRVEPGRKSRGKSRTLTGAVSQAPADNRQLWIEDKIIHSLKVSRVCVPRAPEFGVWRSESVG